jgi:hypothetical protein
VICAEDVKSTVVGSTKSALGTLDGIEVSEEEIPIALEISEVEDGVLVSTASATEKTSMLLTVSAVEDSDAPTKVSISDVDVDEGVADSAAATRLTVVTSDRRGADATRSESIRTVRTAVADWPGVAARAAVVGRSIRVSNGIPAVDARAAVVGRETNPLVVSAGALVRAAPAEKLPFIWDVATPSEDNVAEAPAV